MRNQLIQYRPPRIAFGFLLIATALHWLVPMQALELYSSTPVSLGLVSVGFAIMMIAWWQFRQHSVAICPTANTEHLITDGIYRLTRNPMYLGIVLMLCGVATFFGTLPFYAAALVYFIVMDRFFCRYEEHKLAAAFGRGYADYQSKVRRWI